MNLASIWVYKSSCLYRITKEMLEDEIGQRTELEEEIEYQQRRISSLKGEVMMSSSLFI